MPKSAQKFVASSKYLVVRGKHYLPHIGAVAIVLLSIINVYVVHRPPQQQNVLAAATADPIEQEIDFWKEVVRMHPTYRDGYIELAELYLQKDLKVAAKQAVDKAIEIDPHSDRAKIVLSKIEE